MATDQEVEDQRAKLVELRARVQDAKSGGADTQKELDNEIHLAAMQVEEERLNAELAEIEAQCSPAALARGVEAPLSVLKDQMAAALAQQAGTAENVAADNRAAAPAAPSVPAATDKTETEAKVQSSSKKIQEG